MNDHLQFVLSTALACLPLAVLLAAAALPLTASALAFHPPKRVKVFRDKFGQQTATLAVFLGLAGVACLAAAGLFVNLKFPEWAAFWLGWPLPLAPLAATALPAGACLLTYRASWSSLRDRPALHACLGLAATALGWLTAYLFLVSLRHFVLSPMPPAASAAFFLPPAGSALWLLAAFCPALGLLLAGASATLYLLARRDKDDFGRDYYAYAVQLGSKWALFSSLAAVAILAGLTVALWPMAQIQPWRPLFFWGLGTAVCALLLASALWFLVIRAIHPLRFKVHLISGLALAWIALIGACSALGRLFLG